MKSLYIHIPFCNKICSYCDFCKIYYSKDLVDKYLLSLQDEIKSNYKGETLKTIYVGGGTPSSLSPNQLNKLFYITSPLKLENTYEFTIEFNIEDITKEKLEIVKKNGVNRISIGIQTINDKFFSLLDRNNNIEDIIDKIKLCKKYFSNINIDLIYGFNNQTISDLDLDLDFLLKLDVSHISIYSLILEEHTKLFVNNYQVLNEDIESQMYYHIIKRLKRAGYFHYEISNFSKKGFASKHNLNYWNNEKYYGFGMGASGYIDNVRYTNTRSINNYLKGSAVFEKELIDKQNNMEYEMICGLRKIEGVSKNKFYDKFDCHIKEVFDLDDLFKKRLLEENEEFIFIPEDKLYVSNSILERFILD